MWSAPEHECVDCQNHFARDPNWALLPVLYPCLLCGAGLCGVHAKPLRVLDGMACSACTARRPCVTCAHYAESGMVWRMRRARHTCLVCGAVMCALHTHELEGHVVCARCNRSTLSPQKEVAMSDYCDDDGADIPNLGKCCRCLKNHASVVWMAPFEVPKEGQGRGWGCFVCGLPENGAVSVLCEPCSETLEGNADMRDQWEMMPTVCIGYPSDNHRTVLHELVPFHHDLSRH